jgi:hypothetical protein
LLGSQRTQELGLFLGGLEASVTKLGRGIDELEVRVLQVDTRRVLHHGLAEHQRALLDTDNGALKHNPVLVDFTITDKATQRGDALLGKIGIGLATRFVALLSDAVHLLVKLGTVEVSVLTGTGNSGGHTGRMPGSDTGDLTQTTVGLTRQTSDTPTGGHTFVTVTLGHTNHINVLVLAKDTVNSDLLLKQVLGKVNLGGSVTSVDLDLHNVSLLDTKVQLADLGVGDNTDNAAELLDTLQLVINVLGTVLVFLNVLGVRLFLALVPVLVAATLKFLTQMLGKDGGQSTKTRGGLDVSDNTNDDHGRGLDDGDGVNDLTLVHEGTGTVHSTDNVRHTGLVPAKGGEMGRFGRVILGEGANATEVVLRTLLGQETQVTAAGVFKFTVRPALIDQMENVSKR